MSRLPSISNIGPMLKAVWRDDSNQNQKIRRILRATGWQLWKRLIRTPLQVSLFNGMRFSAYPDCTISSSTLYFRVPSYHHVEFIRQHAHGGTLLDVGANVGLFTLLLADKVEGAFLFEPNPVAAGRARENLQLNKLNFEVLEIAASDESGEVAFENGGGVTPVNRTVVGFTSSVPTIKVRRQALDEFLLQHPPPAPVRIVKIDVEGHENAVLRGMRGCLRDMRPLVMFEYLARTNVTETFEIFRSVGYRVLAFSETGTLEWATPHVKPLQDLFACPEEMSSQLVA